MQWLDSFTFIMRSNLNTLREKMENPERLLTQLLIDMEEELERVRASVADAIADEIQTGKAAKRACEEAVEWGERARASLKRGDDGTAKGAIEQKLGAERRAAELEAEHGKQKSETAKLQAAVRDLEDKIRQGKQRRTLLLARFARADSGDRIERALERAGSDSAFAQFHRLEERVERAEARSEAYARMEGRDPGAEELRREFEEKERQEMLEKELEKLKRAVEEGGAA